MCLQLSLTASFHDTRKIFWSDGNWGWVFAMWWQETVLILIKACCVRSSQQFQNRSKDINISLIVYLSFSGNKVSSVNYIYRPQRSWGKVMFLQASVILLTRGCLPQCMLGYPLEADTPPPPRAHTHPREQTPPEQMPPPGADTPPRSRHPWADTPWEQTSPEQTLTSPRSRHPLGADTPPLCIAYWEIRSMRGRYASYWNAILFIAICDLLKTLGKKGYSEFIENHKYVTSNCYMLLCLDDRCVFRLWILMGVLLIMLECFGDKCNQCKPSVLLLLSTDVWHDAIHWRICWDAKGLPPIPSFHGPLLFLSFTQWKNFEILPKQLSGHRHNTGGHHLLRGNPGSANAILFDLTAHFRYSSIHNFRF